MFHNYHFLAGLVKEVFFRLFCCHLSLVLILSVSSKLIIIILIIIIIIIIIIIAFDEGERFLISWVSCER